MRKLIIRDHRGHAVMDLDTSEAILELVRGMNNGMLAVATKNGVSTQVQTATEEIVREADEVRLMHPLAGG